MGMLSDFLAAVDSTKRVYGRKLADLLRDPVGYSQQRAAQITEDGPQKLADNLMGLAPGSIPSVGGGMLGTFIGKNAKTWDALAHEKALQMASKGEDPRKIWQETGNWKGPDGNWRQEIPDNASLFNTSVKNGVKTENDLTIGYPGIDLGNPVGNLIEHPQLGKAYGDLAKSTFVGNKNTFFGDGVQGSFNDGILTINAPAKAADAKSTTLHELQHAIQQREGWARGGSPDTVSGSGLQGREQQFEYARKAYESSKGLNGEMSSDQLLAELLGEKFTPTQATAWNELTDRQKLDWLQAGREYAYRRLAGEAEARATQSRMNMDMAERLKTFPADSYDVPLSQLIFRYGDGKSSSMGMMDPSRPVPLADLLKR